MATTRWNVAVSTETDKALRIFLASQGCGRKCDRSRFVDEPARAHMLELSAEEAKAANAGVSKAELAVMVDEGLDWAKARQCARCSTPTSYSVR